MIEILTVLAVIAGIVLLVVALKLVFAIVGGILHATFWLLGGLFKLVLLPFQIVGGLLLGLAVLVLAAVALPIMLAVGVPLLLVAGVACLLLVGLVVMLVSGLAGWC